MLRDIERGRNFTIAAYESILCGVKFLEREGKSCLDSMKIRFAYRRVTLYAFDIDCMQVESQKRANEK
jgi:hypothetical protein